MIELITSEVIDLPGLYRQSEAAYHADPCPAPSLSRSIALKLVQESPRHGYAAHPRLTKQKEKDEKNDRARDIGSAAHALLLGQPVEIAELPYTDFRKEEAKKKRLAIQKRGGIPLLSEDYATVQAMVEKARIELATNENESIRSIVSPDPAAVAFNEVTGAWIDPCGKHWARFRADRLHMSPLLLSIIDYKTTEMSAAPEKVSSAIYNNQYHFQEAFYRRGARILFPAIDRHELKLEFLFIVQEQEAPYEITVARVDAAGRMIGEKMVSAAFRLWRKCWADNHWPGYPNETVTAEMPPYVDTRWSSKEIEDPRLQHLGFDPVLPFESNPYKPRQIMEPN